MRMRFVLSFVLVAVCSVRVWGQIADRISPDMKSARIPTLASVTLNPTSILGGGVVGGSVTLSGVAQSGVTVKLTSSRPSDAAVPASVAVQPGSATANFVIQTYPVGPSEALVEISAAIGTLAPKTATMTVLPPTIHSVTVNPKDVGGGSLFTVQVNITAAAPKRGLPIDLSCAVASPGDPSTVTITPRIIVAGGATSATTQAKTKLVTERATAVVTASLGSASKTAAVAVYPVQIVQFSQDPVFVIGGTPIKYSVKLNAPAPPEGITFPLSMRNEPYGPVPCGPAPTTPPSFTFPGGSTSGVITITTYPGGGLWFLNFGGPGSNAIKVHAPVLRQNALEPPASVKGGQTVQAKLSTDGAAGPANCNNTYKLESSNPLYAQVPASVTMSPGAAVATFPITTSAVAVAQSVTIKVFGYVGNAQGSQTAVISITP